MLDPYFSATKIEWLLTEGGVELDADPAFGTIDAWLLWNLTGGDGARHRAVQRQPHDAARHRRRSPGPTSCATCSACPATSLPEVRPSSGRFGTVTGVAGVPAGIPMSGIAGDQQAALFGQACFEPGITKNTYGTGSFVLMNVGDRRAPSRSTGCSPPSPGPSPTAAARRTDYALEGAIFATGAAVQWLRDGLGVIAEAAEIGPLAASVDTSDGVYLVPAFTGLGSPWWDPYARGTIVGITRGTTRAHLARAVVEAMAFQTRDVVDAMSARSGRPVRRAARSTAARR